MSFAKLPNRGFLRAVAPTLIGLLFLIAWICDLHHQYGLILSVPAAHLAPLVFGFVLYGIFRSQILLLLLILDAVSLFASFIAVIVCDMILFGFLGPPHNPYTWEDWLLLATLVPAALAAIPTLVLTAGDLKRLWIATRTFFGHPPKPAPILDPAEFPVTPGWDEQTPR